MTDEFHIPAVAETTVYLNDDNDVVIKQDDWIDREAIYVVIPKHNIPGLIAFLSSIVDEGE